MKQIDLLKIIDTELMERLYRFCYARTACSHEAEELCSDILFAYINACKDGREIENPNAYFWSVARRVYADFCEKRRGKAEKLIPGNPEELLSRLADTGVKNEAEMKEDRRLLTRVYRQIARLSRAYRIVMVGYYLDGKSTAVLAGELGISETTVRQRLFSARNDVRNEVKKMSETKISQKPMALAEMDWTVWGTGSPADGDPRDVCSRQFSKHVIWLCRNKPNTAKNIAEELGVPMPYVEEELELQVRGTNGRYGTLRKIGADRYVKNFVLLDEREIEAVQKLYLDRIPMICDTVADYIVKHKDEYLAFPYINKKPDFNLILWQQISPMAHVMSECVKSKLKTKYLSDITPAKRPFTVFGYKTPENAPCYGGGWDGINANEICGYRSVHMDNIYIGRIKAHFHCGNNISTDAKLRLAIRAINGIRVDSLQDGEREYAAKAIECGYLYKDGDLLYTKFLVCRQQDAGKLFSLTNKMSDVFETEADSVAAVLADFVKKNLPSHLLDDYIHVNTLANMPVLDTLVESLIERGLLIPPDDGVGAEGIWMTVNE